MAQGDIIKIMRQNGNGSQLVGMNKNQVGLNNVDNTADVDKPISTAQNDRFNSVEAIANAAAPQATTYTKTEVAGSIGRINSPLLDLPLKNSLAMKAGVGSVIFTNGYVLETAYDSGATYATGDKASYNGFNYISKYDSNSGNTPGNANGYWQLSAPTYIDRCGFLRYAGVNEPRFEEKGVLIESDITNLTVYSEDGANYTYYSANHTDNAYTAPNGSKLATKVTVMDDGQNGIVAASAVITSGDTAGDTYTCSVFVKKLIQSTITYNCYKSGSSEINVDFNFNTEQATNPAMKVEKLTNGWFRLSIVVTVESDNTDDKEIKNKVWSGGRNSLVKNNGCYVFGFQIEKQSFASSYIPTYGTTVTRVKDSLSVSELYKNFSSTNNLTIYAETSCNGFANGFPVVIYAVPFIFNFRSDGQFTLNTSSGGYTTSEINYLDTIGKTVKMVGTIDGKHISVYKNGVLGLSRNLIKYAQPVTNRPINIGGNGGSALQLNGHVKNFKVYDVALTPTDISLLAGGTI